MSSTCGNSRSDDVGTYAVGVVVRLESDHLVARFEQGEEGGGDGFRGARGDQHLSVRVVAKAVEPLLMARDGVPELGDAGGGRVLVALAGHDRVGGGLGDNRRAV